MSPLGWALHLLVGLMGAAVAIAAVAVHRIDVPVLGGSAPVGLLLALSASFAMVWALRLIAEPSRTATSYALGWLVAFAFLLFGRPEGDYLVAADGVGYTLMVAGLAVVALGIFSGRRVTDSRSGASPT